MENVSIIASDLGKSYNGYEFIFRNLNFEIYNGDVFGILGPNGSGKSTLLKILAKAVIPTEGTSKILVDGAEIEFERQRTIQGFVSPYLVLFEEFKPLEHFEIFAKILGIEFNITKALELLDFFNLSNAANKTIKEFSSGMKQRVKYILAFLLDPLILFLDEPFTNLDEIGISRVIEYLEHHKKAGRITVIATNDEREANLCNKSIFLKKLSADEPNFDSPV